MLEVLLQIHATTVFVLHTYLQISDTTSKLSCIAQMTTVNTAIFFDCPAI
jgi:hypothetical protein